jgi:hypothetical protein
LYLNSWDMKDIAKEVCKQINKPSARLLFYLTSDDYCKFIKENESAYSLSSDMWTKEILVREFEEGEENNDQNVQVVVFHTVKSSYFHEDGYRKTLSVCRLHYFKPSMTLK